MREVWRSLSVSRCSTYNINADTQLLHLSREQSSVLVGQMPKLTFTGIVNRSCITTTSAKLL